MVYRMCALREFKSISKSNLDHFIEHEGALNYKGDCWRKYHINGRGFIENRRVLADVIVCDDVSFSMDICAYDSIQIYCMLPVFSIIHVYSNTQIYGCGAGESRLYVCNKIKICYASKVNGNAHFDDDALVYNCVEILKNYRYVDVLVIVYTKVREKAKIYSYLEVCHYEDFCNEKEICIGKCILHHVKKVSKNDTRPIFAERIRQLALFEIICVFAFCINQYDSRNWCKRMGLGSFMGLPRIVC